MIKVAARTSSLSKAQTSEVQSELKRFYPDVDFECQFVESYGDKDLLTSLRNLEKTDFFTREIDALVLQDLCRIAIHSAKDLPDPIPKGLSIIAITCGIDPSDSLVLREKDTLQSLPKGAKIATSSYRREEAIKSLRSDFLFCDIRGSIQARLKQLELQAIDGVVIAEAALIRLNLKHLNRYKLPQSRAPLQGQLAILAKETDEEMKTMFKNLDSRIRAKTLYPGPNYPHKKYSDKYIVHIPFSETIRASNTSFEMQKLVSEWPKFTHIIFTSKSTVIHLLDCLREAKICFSSLHQKQCIAIGEATAEILKGQKIDALLAKEENAEGFLPYIDRFSLDDYVLWPHSALSRPLLGAALKNKKIPHYDVALYEIKPKEMDPPDLQSFDEVLFSSPSTVNYFFKKYQTFPNELKFTAIGPITLEALAKYKRIR